MCPSDNSLNGSQNYTKFKTNSYGMNRGISWSGTECGNPACKDLYKKISQRKSDNYHFYLGEYRLIKSGKHYPKSLFYSGAHKLLLELFPNCIYSCFVHIAMKNFEKATSCFANNSSKEKAYLDSIDIEKLLTTANLWYSQGSVLLAFQYF